MNWVLDADIRGFFDAIDHGWLVKFVEHRIGDRRVVRLIQKWLSAGVMEDGRWTASEVGSPQGATVSPLLANRYLHYVLDRWAHQWRRRHARGDIVFLAMEGPPRDSLDPEFLAATTRLRRWLWPHTFQNPLDVAGFEDEIGLSAP